VKARWWIGGAAALYALLVAAGGVAPTTPFDFVMTLGRPPHRAHLAQTDGVRRVVFVLHGLARSSASMARLSRGLRDHGYTVVDVEYPSTDDTIENHAQRLRAVVEAERRANGDAPCAFVGHSLGGLVVRRYLANAGSVAPFAVVFLGTPHRGACIVPARRDLMAFQWIMGRHAAVQMDPSDPFLASLPAPSWPAGCVIGGRGDGEGWNETIPGDDDGTVAVDEALLVGAQAVLLPIGHTNLSIHDDAIAQTLTFLKHQRFAPR
jgi:pimeloyl-ACP methyl ester carboxylesterase